MGKKIGVALGGGGVRGVAHIAYLDAMEQAGLPPDIIAGTSSGAVVGALYAAGLNPRQIFERAGGFFSTSKRLSLFTGIINGSRAASFIKDYFDSILPEKHFEELKIPLKIVATNFNTLEETVFDKGEIIPALMGSIALPSLLTPQCANNAHYIDGGSTNLVPFDIIRNLCDVLVAVDVSKASANSFAPNAKNAFKASWAATQETIIRLKLNFCAVELFERPVFNNVSTLEFKKYKQIFMQAQEMMPAFTKNLLCLKGRVGI